MSMLPSKDKELIEAVRLKIYANTTPISEIGGEQLIEAIDRIVVAVINEFEKRGYHKGLPSSIEEALNSGDGSYKP